MRPFTEVIGDLRSGALDQLNAKLDELVEAVIETRKPGELTFKIKIKPNGDGSVEIEDDIKAKVPELPRGKTIMFVDADNSLRRSDPRQPDLPLREVAKAGEKLRDPAPAATA